MKNHRPMSPRQIAKMACLFTLLGLIGIVPWRVVAQEANPKNELATHATAESKTPAKTVKELIIGAWRGGPSGTAELVIEIDGKYSWLQSAIVPEGEQAEMQGTAFYKNGFTNLPGFRFRSSIFNQESGSWKLRDDGVLVLVSESSVPTIRGLPIIKPNQIRPEITEKDRTKFYKIARLDGDLLRLQPLLDESQKPSVEKDAQNWTLFFRRSPVTPPSPAAVDKLSASAQQVVQLMRLDAEELKVFEQIAREASDEKEASEEHGFKPIRFELLQRIVAARQRKIDFAGLFELTPDEATACIELFKMTDGPTYSSLAPQPASPSNISVPSPMTYPWQVGSDRYLKIVRLADDGQLSPVELAAVNKLKNTKAAIEAMRKALLDPLIDLENRHRERVAQQVYDQREQHNNIQHGGLPPEARPIKPQPAIDPVEKASGGVLRKLIAVIDELETWLNATVFAS